MAKKVIPFSKPQCEGIFQARTSRPRPPEGGNPIDVLGPVSRNESCPLSMEMFSQVENMSYEFFRALICRETSVSATIRVFRSRGGKRWKMVSIGPKCACNFVKSLRK